MGHDHWLSHEVSRWIQERIISREEGNKILALYKKGNLLSFSGEAFFIFAFFCLMAGAAFVAAGFWNEMSQDERFMLAVVPLFMSLLMEAVVLIFDKKIPDESAKKEALQQEEAHNLPRQAVMPFGASEGTMAEAVGESEEAPAEPAPEAEGKRLRSYHHRIPGALREAVGVFHGGMLLFALWMVHDSFWLSPDLYPLALAASLFLLVMMYVSRSAGLGILYMISCVGIYRLSPIRGWQDGAAWAGMILALPFLASLLAERRQRAVVCFSWIWALGLLFLIHKTTANLLWQTLFFSLAASLTWMAGGVLRSYGAGALALRFFGGIAVAAALLEGSFGNVWHHAFGGWLLWVLFLVFLALDAVLLLRMGFKKEWLSMLAGLTPFVMMAAALISLFDGSGATSATLVSLYGAALALGVIGRGYQTGSAYQRWGGMILLFATGVVRIVDSTLSFGQRGLFFLGIGLLATLCCIMIAIPGMVRGTRKKRKPLKQQRREEEASLQEGSPSEDEAILKGGDDHD